LLDPLTEYSVTAGPWNWISYPFNQPQPITESLASIADQIVIVYTDDGRLWIPPLNINTIGNQSPGEGFMIITNEDVTFTYNQDVLLQKDAVREEPGGDVVWDIPAVENPPEPTGLPYAVMVQVTDELRELEPAVVELFDGELMVGKGIWLEDKPVTPVTAWEGSEEHNLVGFTVGNCIDVRIWNATGNLIGEFPSGTRQADHPTFGEGAYTEITVDVIQAVDPEPLLPTEFTVGNAYPNPFNSTVTVPFGLPEQGEVTVRLFNILGQLKYESSRSFNAGYHRIAIGGEQTTELVSGMYFLQISAHSSIIVQKIVLLE
ncbi:T9SS type A sorting domain-containing protein, partial [bacterium]|nr:T9SS type A sorting domain-containing protein [bacterium]